MGNLYREAKPVRSAANPHVWTWEEGYETIAVVKVEPDYEAAAHHAMSHWHLPDFAAKAIVDAALGLEGNDMDRGSWSVAVEVPDDWFSQPKPDDWFDEDYSEDDSLLFEFGKEATDE